MGHAPNSHKSVKSQNPMRLQSKREHRGNWHNSYKKYQVKESDKACVPSIPQLNCFFNPLRAYKRQFSFIEVNDEKIETNQKYYYPDNVSGSWLFSRLEGLSNLLVIFTALLAVINRVARSL